MTEEEAERLVNLLQSGHSGIENFLGLPADDRVTIMTMLEQQAWERSSDRYLNSAKPMAQWTRFGH